MGYQDNCARCGESYDSDNLMMCKVCRADVCYRCFGRLPGHCMRCGPDQTQDNTPGKSSTPGAGNPLSM